MKKSLETLFLNADFIKADDTYMSDGICLIKKEFLRSGALRLVKNTDNIFDLAKGTVPYEKGEEFDCVSVGTKCVLLPHYKIAICYNEKYGFNYDYVKMIISQIPYWKITTFYVVENKNKEPILKFFADDEFAGCLMCLKIK